MRTTALFMCGICLLLASCTPKYIKQYKKQMVESPDNQADKDRNAILQYLADNKLRFQATESGIYYSIAEAGEGTSPDKDRLVKAHYKGRLMENGKEFDSSYDRGEPLEFQLNRVIKGWQESIPMLKPGGKGTFIIPSHLAYGERGAGSDIPANSVLIFDVELMDHYTPEEKEERRKEEEQEEIKAYAQGKGWETQATESGIHYRITRKGTGAKPELSDIVKIHYKGMLLDGKVFDSSYDRGEAAQFPLKNLIPGWQEAIPLLHEGGAGTFIIPSHLAYGQRGAGGSIPPHSILVFEVELFKAMTLQEAQAQEEQDKIAQAQEDKRIIGEYISEKLLNAQSTPEGVYYIVEKPGSPPMPNLNSKVTLHYRGTLLDGSEFDSSYKRGQPATFPLGNLITGWQVGIPKFGKGGKGTLIIPSGLGYGAMGSGKNIPPNSILIFDIEILDVQ